jgi:hypothetical protein
MSWNRMRMTPGHFSPLRSKRVVMTSGSKGEPSGVAEHEVEVGRRETVDWALPLDLLPAARAPPRVGRAPERGSEGDWGRPVGCGCKAVGQYERPSPPHPWRRGPHAMDPESALQNLLRTAERLQATLDRVLELAQRAGNDEQLE